MMYALRAHRPGGPEVLVYEQTPVPTLADGEVLIEVRAAAITFAELSWAETWTRDGVDRTPIIPSHEFSGTIAEVSAHVTRLHPGDEVYGLVPFDRDGAAAQYVSVPATQVAMKPRALSHVEAAALPLPALTAQQALFDHAKVTAGENVLVHGGAGGVGGYAVQMAAGIGAHVTATTTGAVGYVRSLGAEHVVDVRTEDFAAHAGGYDVVIDTVGGKTLERSYAVLRRGGRLVTLQTQPDQSVAAQFGITATFFIVSTDAAQLTRLAQYADTGTLRVTVAQTFPLADGQAAYFSGSAPGRAPGKTVLAVAAPSVS
jgi:NADPH:quinone reductase-like Zn-dependent oxidoreductase